jgi:hypothetical protein
MSLNIKNNINFLVKSTGILTKKKKSLIKLYIGMKGKEYYDSHKEDKSAYHKNYYQEKRKLVFDHYGWRCSCCGESESNFLTIDHIHNDGANHKKERTNTLYEWLVKNNFPEGFRTLCYNCNCGRKLGSCPHKNLFWHPTPLFHSVMKGLQEIRESQEYSLLW